VFPANDRQDTVEPEINLVHYSAGLLE